MNLNLLQYTQQENILKQLEKNHYEYLKCLYLKTVLNIINISIFDPKSYEEEVNIMVYNEFYRNGLEYQNKKFTFNGIVFNQDESERLDLDQLSTIFHEKCYKITEIMKKIDTNKNKWYELLKQVELDKLPIDNNFQYIEKYGIYPLIGISTDIKHSYQWSKTNQREFKKIQPLISPFLPQLSLSDVRNFYYHYQLPKNANDYWIEMINISQEMLIN